MLEADWYVIPQAARGDYTRVSVEIFPGRAEAIRRYTNNLTPVESIPFNEYDLVISFDAILEVPRDHSALFAYYAQEHWDRLYSNSLRRPTGRYDLFLAHMMDSQSSITALPQPISFPYVHDPVLTRSMFQPKREEWVWVDWRTLATLACMDLGEPWRKEADAAAERLQTILSIPIRYRGKHHEQTYAFADPPHWGDAATYYEKMARCRYYVGVGRIGGAGQGLGDAASAGCLCIGQSDKAYHRLLCHRACLCEDMAEMPKRLKALIGSKDLQEEVLSFQDEALRTHFKEGPLDLLRRCIEIKARDRHKLKAVNA